MNKQYARTCRATLCWDHDLPFKTRTRSFFSCKPRFNRVSHKHLVLQRSQPPIKIAKHLVLISKDLLQPFFVSKSLSYSHQRDGVLLAVHYDCPESQGSSRISLRIWYACLVAIFQILLSCLWRLNGRRIYGGCTPLRSFFISDFFLKDTKKVFASAIKIKI